MRVCTKIYNPNRMINSNDLLFRGLLVISVSIKDILGFFNRLIHDVPKVEIFYGGTLGPENSRF